MANMCLITAGHPRICDAVCRTTPSCSLVYPSHLSLATDFWSSQGQMQLQSQRPWPRACLSSQVWQQHHTAVIASSLPLLLALPWRAALRLTLLQAKNDVLKTRLTQLGLLILLQISLLCPACI